MTTIETHNDPFAVSEECLRKLGNEVWEDFQKDPSARTEENMVRFVVGLTVKKMFEPEGGEDGDSN